MSVGFQVRLDKKVNRRGEVQVYATSLLDKGQYAAKSIINLYKKRWEIEEAYKLIKSRLEVADFFGKTLWAVQQDFDAKTMLISLCNALCFDIEPKHVKQKMETPPQGHRSSIGLTHCTT